MLVSREGFEIERGRGVGGVTKPSSYPFVERHLWRKRAVGLFVALARLGGRTSERKREVQVSP
jgi:hypothetical protein